MNVLDLLTSYEMDVQHSDVSGFEHLQMLMNRSDIAEAVDVLSPRQKTRLRKADNMLLENAPRFAAAIEDFGSGGLAVYRQDHPKPPAHWWWYLDVIAAAYGAWRMSETPEPSKQVA